MGDGKMIHRSKRLQEVLEKVTQHISSMNDDIKKYTKFLQESLPEDAEMSSEFGIDHRNKGQLIATGYIKYKVNLGYCWTCYDCNRTFTDVPYSHSRQVGGHYEEEVVYTCEECVSYWYGRENYGKEKPEYLNRRR